MRGRRVLHARDTVLSQPLARRRCDGGRRETEGIQWHSVEHSTRAEYQTLLKDIVMESDYLGG